MMKKTNKYTVCVKISLVLSTLLFIGAAQSTLGVNVLQPEDSQTQKKDIQKGKFIAQEKALQKAIQTSDVAVTNTVGVITNTVVDATTASISHAVKKQNQSSNIISSGSNINSNNGWNIQGNIFTANINQESNEEIKKYKTGINGILFTVNKYLNKKAIIGVTGLYSNLNIQYDESINHILNKTDCNAFSLSLNGRYYPQQNIFTQGILGFIKYDGKTEYVASQPSSEINGNGYYGDFMLGWDLHPYSSKLTLSPIVGIRYSTLKNASYKLFDGTTVGNAEHYLLEGRIGATIKYIINNKSISIMPELHAIVHRNLYTNSSNLKLEYPLLANSGIVDIKTASMPKLLGQLGGALTMQSGKIGFGLSYSAYLAANYIAHVGSINIKANF
ncbi:outer membrane autotransporter barrel domain protein [Orientia chuto str. Dubai]|uniref:Outer membrane autotransporter barrel domain protein n=1 Tax=Orientia chuto str. Dubai TaxID=1359168 RepID=A0A0F3MNM5_9RICK|nr:autotransporter outer membrane beta-barrel domain-containing protein [Candidatus Orientia mediorientalis]KJV57261.1 outer membrane autotransporter barrel domain protein [Orientia chuto str. Dubai]